MFFDIIEIKKYEHLYMYIINYFIYKVSMKSDLYINFFTVLTINVVTIDFFFF